MSDRPHVLTPRILREARENEELAKHRAERPKIQQQFADLNRGLAVVTDEEWESIPKVGNLTRKKRKRDESSFVVSDSVIVGDRARTEYKTSLDSCQQATGGFETPADNGILTNFAEMSQARDKILSLKLDQASGTATSGLQTSIDPKGYLTSLDSVVLKTDAEIGDIKRARMLFDSLVKSNPKHAPGWIAGARLEEHAGRTVAARKLIKQGCERCPKNEDVWLEAARLHNNDDPKVILANAVQHVGQSVKIWMASADLEHDIKAKKRVLRKALEHIPNSVRLWKETVNLESSASDARIVLSRAVEIADKAKAVLNKARKAVPTSHEIWIAAGRLHEQEAYATEKSDEQREKELALVDKTIEAGVRELRRHQNERAIRTCEGIIKATIAMGVEEEDRLDTWTSDTEAAEAKGNIGAARAILAYALRVFPDKKSLWRKAADLEKARGTRESLNAILERAVHHCPQAEVLWLMWAKEKWMAGDVPAAREVHERVFVANSESKQIWLAAVKLEAENGELGVARELPARARTVADTQRIWMKSAVFERQQGQLANALETLATAIKKYAKFAKLYMIRGQIHQQQGDLAAARTSYAAGIQACHKDVNLWILASRLEEADKKSINARALLDKARSANPGSDVLWAEAVGVEERSGGAAHPKMVLARGLQECPTSGLLWSMAIWAEPRPSPKAKSADALRKAGNDPWVLSSVARLFWAERKIEKARDWFGHAVAANEQPSDTWGDIWAWWLKFERQHGTKQEQVIQEAISAEPWYGPTWQPIAKDIANTRKSTREILELVANALHWG
ncbi:hypothetical protein C8Q76DRAFT_723324, partial [Earliella scabrosa]